MACATRPSMRETRALEYVVTSTYHSAGHESIIRATFEASALYYSGVHGSCTDFDQEYWCCCVICTRLYTRGSDLANNGEPELA